jgi:hypothetical protein
MSIKESQNPLSITNRVRDRIDKRASGSQPENYVHTPGTFAGSSTTFNQKPFHQDHLSNEFLSLLMNTDSPESNLTREEKNSDEIDSKTNFGTNLDFLSLKQQEQSSAKAEQTKEPFSLVIENSTLGPLKINGSWKKGMLHVTLTIPGSISSTEKKVLCAMLSKGLSSKLGVPLEISID